MRDALVIIALIALAGCTGTEGTLNVELAFAPGSNLLDGVQTLRFTVTAPNQVTLIERTADGFDLSLDLPAEGTNRAIIVEGQDAGGATIATGESPGVPINAINAKLVIYMAAPMSIAASPAALTPARSAIGVGELTYGAIFVGGSDAAGVPSAAVGIYNVYDHSLAVGLNLPAARSGAAIGVTRANNAYVFGGHVAGGAATGSLLVFQSSVAPNGAYIDLGDHPEFSRADQLALRSGVDQFIVSGSPVVEIGGSSIAARSDLATLPAVGAALTATDGTITAVFACTGPGTSGLSRFRNDVLDELAGDPMLAGATATAIPHGGIVIAGGRHTVALADLVHIDPISGVVDVHPVLETPREHAATAATTRHLVVAGGRGTDGLLVPTAEIFDAVTLAHVKTLPLVVPRADATAIALANDQILIVGGVDVNGLPIEIIELFTPPAPDL